MSSDDERQHVVPLAGALPDPDPGFGQLKRAIDRLNSDPAEAERVDVLLEEIDIIDGTYHAGVASRSKGDVDLAERELRRAVRGGHPEATFELAELLAYRASGDPEARPRRPGRGSDELLREAAIWLQEGVDAGAVAIEDLDQDLTILIDAGRSGVEVDARNGLGTDRRAGNAVVAEPVGLAEPEPRAQRAHLERLRARTGVRQTPQLGMISPYVRRLRLAAELRALRAESGLTQEHLAKQIGQSRAQILRLENGHVVDQDHVMRIVMRILGALGVDDERWTQIMTIAREAGERGWWESNKAMGDRQALYANLEAGARTIREFQMTFIPGLLQTPEFTRVRGEADRLTGRTSYTADKAAAGRLGRQRMLRRPTGPGYEVVIDELAIRRAAAPWTIVRAQLYHIAATVNGSSKIVVRVLPIDARIEGHVIPPSAFSIYTFTDPGDPKVVAVDTVTDDLVLTELGEPDAVARYEELYRRILGASLPMLDSIELLIDLATAPPPPEPTARIAERRARRTATRPIGADVTQAVGEAGSLAG